MPDIIRKFHPAYGPVLDMLTGEQIAETDLTDLRKLSQGLHARYVVGDFGTSVRFVAAVGEAGDALGHHARVTMGGGCVDFKPISNDAIYRDDGGTEHVWGDPAGRQPRATDHRDRRRAGGRRRPGLDHHD